MQGSAIGKDGVHLDLRFASSSVSINIDPENNKALWEGRYPRADGHHLWQRNRRLSGINIHVGARVRSAVGLLGRGSGAQHFDGSLEVEVDPLSGHRG